TCSVALAGLDQACLLEGRVELRIQEIGYRLRFRSAARLDDEAAGLCTGDELRIAHRVDEGLLQDGQAIGRDAFRPGDRPERSDDGVVPLLAEGRHVRHHEMPLVARDAQDPYLAGLVMLGD